MFATVMIQGTGVGSDFIQVPTGWTSIIQTNCGTDFLQSLSYRIAIAGDSAGNPYTWNFCTDSGCGTSVNAVGTGSIVNYSDVNAAPIQSGTGTPACNCTDSTTATTTATVTPTVANSLVIAKFGSVGNQELSAPAGFINIFEHANTSGPDNRESWGVKPNTLISPAVQSTYGIGSPTASDNVGCLISLNPGS